MVLLRRGGGGSVVDDDDEYDDYEDEDTKQVVNIPASAPAATSVRKWRKR